MNEKKEEEYEMRDADGTINTLALELWQLDLDNSVAIISTEYFS